MGFFITGKIIKVGIGMVGIINIVGEIAHRVGKYGHYRIGGHQLSQSFPSARMKSGAKIIGWLIILAKSSDTKIHAQKKEQQYFLHSKFLSFSNPNYSICFEDSKV